MKQVSLLKCIKKGRKLRDLFFTTKSFVSNSVSKMPTNNKINIKYQHLNSKQSGLHHAAHTTHAAHVRHCWFFFRDFSDHALSCEH